MEDQFNNYIHQLQDLENAENVASLKAFRDMNVAILSFYPIIIGNIDRVIRLGSVSFDTIQEIKEKVGILIECKKEYEKLLSSRKSKMYALDIQYLLERINEITLHEVSSYKEEISAALYKNEKQLIKESEHPVPKIDPIQQEIARLEKLMFNTTTSIPQNKLLLIAEHSTNPHAIARLMYSNSISILESLLKNENVKDTDKSIIRRRIKEIINSKKEYLKETSGCLGSLASFIFLGSITTFMIYLGVKFFTQII